MTHPGGVNILDAIKQIAMMHFNDLLINTLLPYKILAKITILVKDVILCHFRAF